MRAFNAVTKLFATFALLALATLCWSQAPQVADPRVIINRLDSNYRQFNAVGIVYPIARTDGTMVMTKYRGTGVMISPCHLLTNYHVAFEAARREVMFEVGQPANDIAAFTLRGVGRILDAGPFWTDADTVDDWALVKLTDPKSGRSNNLGERVGFFQFAAAPPEAIVARPLISAGYPGNMNAGLVGHLNCRLARVDQDRRWRMACAMTEGQSGGPVTLRTADRGDVLIAMNSAKPDGHSGLIAADELRLSNLNYATAITRAAETRIRRGMDANRCD